MKYMELTIVSSISSLLVNCFWDTNLSLRKSSEKVKTESLTNVKRYTKLHNFNKYTER